MDREFSLTRRTVLEPPVKNSTSTLVPNRLQLALKFLPDSTAIVGGTFQQTLNVHGVVLAAPRQAAPLPVRP